MSKGKCGAGTPVTWPDKKKEYRAEPGYEGIELESKCNLSDVRKLGFFDKARLESLVPQEYALGHFQMPDKEIHHFYGFFDKKGQALHAFTLMHSLDRGSRIKIKENPETLYESPRAVVLARNETMHTLPVSDHFQVADYIAQATEEAQEKGMILRKVGKITKEKRNLGMISGHSHRLYVATPSICTLDNGKELHQFEIEYVGREVGYKRISLPVKEELIWLTGEIVQKIKPPPKKKGDTLTKFDWILRNA